MRKLFAIAVLAVSISALGEEKKEFKTFQFKDEVIKVKKPKSFLLTGNELAKSTQFPMPAHIRRTLVGLLEKTKKNKKKVKETIDEIKGQMPTLSETRIKRANTALAVGEYFEEFLKISIKDFEGILKRGSLSASEVRKFTKHTDNAEKITALVDRARKEFRESAGQ